MSNAPKLGRQAIYADLEALPEGVKGEILDGVLYTQPRPRFRHGRAAGTIFRALGAYDSEGPRDPGPGGWWLIIEPGVELPNSPEVAPDVAGWRRERFTPPGPDEPIRVVPDWVCEVLSRSNRAYDRRTKFPYYARVGVRHLWVVDPEARTVEVKKLVDTRWTDVATFAQDDVMSAEPFEACAIALAAIWVP